jgi:hypothetical protein
MDKDYEIFLLGWKVCEESYQTTIQFGCNLSPEEYWEDYKNGKLTKEGKYVG